MKDKISVIVPVFNVEKYLEKCIDSIINQTYKTLQIILVDDGSTDSSGEICDSYALKDSRVQVIHINNSGLPAARNEGLKYANGEYFSFVDSDDWIDSEMYAYLYEQMKLTDAEVGTVEYFKANGDSEEKDVSKEKIQLLNQNEFAKIFFKIDSQKIVYYVWNRLYSSKVIERGMFEDGRSIGEDVIATYRVLLKCNKIVVSSKKMYYYRQNSGMTGKFNEKYFELVDIWNKVVEITRREKPEYLNYAQLNLNRIYFTLLSEMAINGVYNEEKYEKKIKEYLNNLKKNKKKLKFYEFDIDTFL